MTVVHRVTGYDKRSERLERERDIPAEYVEAARKLADAPPNVSQAPGAFPLAEPSGRALARLLDFPMNFDRYDWFVEPIEI